MPPEAPSARRQAGARVAAWLGRKLASRRRPYLADLKPRSQRDEELRVRAGKPKGVKHGRWEWYEDGVDRRLAAMTDEEREQAQASIQRWIDAARKSRESERAAPDHV